MNKVKIIFASLMTATLMLVPVAALAQTQVSNDITSGLCNGSNNGQGGSCDSADQSQDQIQGLVTTIINIFSWVVGVVSVLMIIYGGFQYITSGGGEGVGKAKNIIMYAIIGLVVVAFAQVIVHFVLGSITSTVNN
jgi:hypothetical protein